MSAYREPLRVSAYADRGAGRNRRAAWQRPAGRLDGRIERRKLRIERVVELDIPIPGIALGLCSVNPGIADESGTVQSEASAHLL
jgi:hypothetical protein